MEVPTSQFFVAPYEFSLFRIGRSSQHGQDDGRDDGDDGEAGIEQADSVLGDIVRGIRGMEHNEEEDTSSDKTKTVCLFFNRSSPSFRETPQHGAVPAGRLLVTIHREVCSLPRPQN